MFVIEEEKFGNFTRVNFTNSMSGESISFVPEFGANIIEMNLRCGQEIYSILDGYRNPEDLIKHEYFKNAKLSPFPNRICDGKYYFSGNSFQLPLNKLDEHHAIHGFVWDKKFTIIDKYLLDDRITVVLWFDYNGEISGYSFPFRLELQYSMYNSGGFKCLTTIKNTGNEKMPLGDGWHPYFKVKGIVNDLIIEIPVSDQLELNERLIPTGQRKKSGRKTRCISIRDSVIDECYNICANGAISSIKLFNPKTRCKIYLWQETGQNKYNYLQIYIPPSRRSIALEPMTCPANSFNNQLDLIVLEPGDIFQAAYGVSQKNESMEMTV